MAPTRVKIPLSKGLYLNSDPLETSDFASALMNCFITKAGAMTKRPGLTTAVNLGTNRPVEGLYWFNEAGYALAVSDGKVFKITKSGGLYSSTELTGSTLRNYSATGGTGRVTFTDDGVNVYMANGGEINYHVAASLTAQPLSDADAPTTVSHVAYMNNRVIAYIDGTSRFQWSDIGNGLSWTATAWATSCWRAAAAWCRSRCPANRPRPRRPGGGRSGSSPCPAKPRPSNQPGASSRRVVAPTSPVPDGSPPMGL